MFGMRIRNQEGKPLYDGHDPNDRAGEYLPDPLQSGKLMEMQIFVISLCRLYCPSWRYQMSTHTPGL